MTIEQINNVSQGRYGVGMFDLSPLGALWLAEYIHKEMSYSVWRVISEARSKRGKGTQFPGYNSPCFPAY